MDGRVDKSNERSNPNSRIQSVIFFWGKKIKSDLILSLLFFFFFFSRRKVTDQQPVEYIKTKGRTREFREGECEGGGGEKWKNPRLAIFL